MKPTLTISFVCLCLTATAACQQESAAEQADPAERAEAKSPAETRTEAPSMRDMDEGPPAHITFRPSAVQWKDGPASFEQGAKMAVLEGDPAKPGVFTMQLKLPDKFVINPHSHPNVERVTVLKGTFHLGSGSSVDKERAEALPTGTYTSMPPKMVHYAMAEGETIVQLTSVGPWEINYVNPQHDPRKRKQARSSR